MKIVCRNAALEQFMEKVSCVLAGLMAALLLGIAVHGAVEPVHANDAEVYLRRADQEGFRRAASLSPQSSAPWIGLGLLAENKGNVTEAEHDLMYAATLDRGYVPRWTLANLYLRHADARAWPMLAEALRIAVHGGQDSAALFEISWQFCSDSAFLLREVVGRSPENLRLYVRFLLDTHRTYALLEPSLLLAASAPGSEMALLMQASDRLLSAGDGAGAKRIWETITPPNHSGQLLANTEFRTPSQLGFDWRYNSIPESRISFEGLARFDFTGRQPDPLELLFQTALLKPGEYTFIWEAKQAPARLQAGLFWQATDAKSGAELFRHTLQAADDWRPESEHFVLHTAALVRLSLHAERPPGHARFEGTVWLRQPSLKIQ